MEDISPVQILSDAPPLYAQVQERIEKMISTQGWTPGCKLPSIRQISDLVGARRATVAKAVTRMIQEGIFDSHPGKGVYISEKSKLDSDTEIRVVYCLVCATGLTLGAENYAYCSPFWSVILNGIRKGFSEQSHDVRLRFSFMDDFLKEKEVTPRGRPWSRVGFAVLGDPKPGQLPQLTAIGRPIVQIHGINSSPNIPSVRVDCETGAILATDHLAKLGHKKIAFLGVMESQHPINFEKFKGYRQGLRNNKLKIEEKYCVSCTNSSGMGLLEEGYQAAHGLMKLSEPPTALLCSNDELALGAMRSVYDCGLKIPQDVSVVGFDNTTSSAYIIPSLTTISTKMEEIGRIGISQLFKRQGHDYILRPELVVRESTGFAPSASAKK